MTVDELRSVLESHRFRFSNEADLQEGISIAFSDHNVEFKREVELGKHDRIDFVVAPRLGVEVKIKETLTNVTRQLHRYALSSLIDAVVFVTTSRKLASTIPRELNGKAIVPIAIGVVL
jgi:hypothetical protein